MQAAMNAIRSFLLLEILQVYLENDAHGYLSFEEA